MSLLNTFLIFDIYNLCELVFVLVLVLQRSRGVIFFTPDEPEIEVDKSLVHGGLGQEAVISCIVYGDPAPSVRWYRDTMVLDRNGNRMMELFGDR